MVRNKELGIVTLSEDEYDKLVNDANRYYALQCGGVDNWEWYSEALHDNFKKEYHGEIVEDEW